MFVQSTVCIIRSNILLRSTIFQSIKTHIQLPLHEEREQDKQIPTKRVPPTPSMRFTTKIFPSVSGNLGIIELNNPKALNALTLDMVHALHDVYAEWHTAPSIKAILVKGSRDTKRPTFCAGGDVKHVYSSVSLSPPGPDAPVGQQRENGRGVPGLHSSDFFRDEYVVNHAIATSSTPQISLWDGVVMGGGVGISIHGKYRVATQNTTLAMPETAIGLFPDVGSMYWMPRMLKGGLPAYLALTGARLEAPDLLYTGLATHYVSSERLQDLQIALVEATKHLKETDVTKDVVAPVLMSFHEMPPENPRESFVAKHKGVIDDVFAGADRVEDIVAKLSDLDSEFGRTTLQTMKRMSPTSMKVTLEGLKRGAKLETIGQDLQMEFRMSQRFMLPGSDFFEGTRAVLVDKDHSPKWNPPTLEEVTDAMVQAYFEPLGENDWAIPSMVETSKL